MRRKIGRCCFLSSDYGVPFCLVVVFFLGIALSGGIAWGEEPPKEKVEKKLKKKRSSRFQRPMITYLGMEGGGLRGLSSQQQLEIEDKIRENIEQDRFIYLRVPFGSGREEDFVQRFVEVVSSRSQGVARMRAKWNTLFQGFKITSKLLGSIQNSSYLYWLELVRVEPLSKIGGIYSYQMRGKVHVKKMLLFDCREANRRLSEQHEVACRGKRASEMAGFAKPFKVFKAMIVGIPSRTRKEALLKTAALLGEDLLKEMSKVDVFKLHAPISWATLNSVHLPLGKKEQMKLNQGFRIYIRHVRGHLMYRGYVKLRSIGDNRMRIEGSRKVRVNPTVPFHSRAEVITTSGVLRLQKGMLAYEDAMIGFSVGIALGALPLSFASFAKKAPSLALSTFGETTIVPAIHIDGSYDLSHYLGMNEVYLKIALDLSVAGIGYSDGKAIKNENLLLIQGHIGLVKKFHLRRLVFLVGLDLGAGAISMDNARLIPSLRGYTGLEFFVSPTWRASLLLGYQAGIPIDKVGAFGPWATLGGVYSF